VADNLTQALKTPRGSMTLRPIQALSLLEVGQYGGGLLPIKVGGGKTLLSLLAPRMLAGARPLLLLPAALRDKTAREMNEYREHWILPPHIQIVSYQTLSTINNADFLEEYQPTMIVCDEAHHLKNVSAAVTKRVSRYMKANPATAFVAMSGTMTKRSVRDFEHLARWCLRDRSPVPREFVALDQWSRALDVNVQASRRMLPGALAELRTDPTESIRKAYQRRLVQTPGVVATQDKPLAIPLTLTSHVLESPGDHWTSLRDDWETPDGWECVDGIEVWRHARELAVGCYYRWDPRPPEDWLAARGAWGSVCRQILKNNRRQLDSELQVVREVQRGGYPPDVGKLYAEWKAIEPTFIPNVEAVWESDHAVQWIARWAEAGPGIVWISHRFLGDRLADLLSLPYYGGGGLDASTGRSIETHDPATQGACVASIAANGTGRNLQAWNRNLIVGVPPNGAQWEQLLGRTHRPGQTRPVHADVLFGCFEDVKAFWQAVADAKYAEEITGQAQKLCHLDLQGVETVHTIGRLPGAQWRKGKPPQ